MCPSAAPDGDPVRRPVPALLYQNVSYGLPREVLRDTRVLILYGCEEIGSEVVLGMSRCPWFAEVPGDGDGRDRETNEAQDRNGKEDLHDCFKKDNKVQRLRAAYSTSLPRIGRYREGR